jgi:hypothetical protein
MYRSPKHETTKGIVHDDILTGPEEVAEQLQALGNSSAFILKTPPGKRAVLQSFKGTPQTR